jgi:hypothetical protein
VSLERAGSRSKRGRVWARGHALGNEHTTLYTLLFLLAGAACRFRFSVYSCLPLTPVPQSGRGQSSAPPAEPTETSANMRVQRSSVSCCFQVPSWSKLYPIDRGSVRATLGRSAIMRTVGRLGCGKNAIVLTAVNKLYTSQSFRGRTRGQGFKPQIPVSFADGSRCRVPVGLLGREGRRTLTTVAAVIVQGKQVVGKAPKSQGVPCWPLCVSACAADILVMPSRGFEQIRLRYYWYLSTGIELQEL